MSLRSQATSQRPCLEWVLQGVVLAMLTLAKPRENQGNLVTYTQASEQMTCIVFLRRSYGELERFDLRFQCLHLPLQMAKCLRFLSVPALWHGHYWPGEDDESMLYSGVEDSPSSSQHKSTCFAWINLLSLSHSLRKEHHNSPQRIAQTEPPKRVSNLAMPHHS